MFYPPPEVSGHPGHGKGAHIGSGIFYRLEDLFGKGLRNRFIRIKAEYPVGGGGLQGKLLLGHMSRPWVEQDPGTGDSAKILSSIRAAGVHNDDLIGKGAAAKDIAYPIRLVLGNHRDAYRWPFHTITPPAISRTIDGSSPSAW
jgi:hypothetical protein